MTPRPYQNDSIAAVFNAFKEHRSTLFVMATGLGKTVAFSHVIDRHLNRQPSSRAIVLAHREELINQAAEKIQEVSGWYPSVEMGDSYSWEGGQSFNLNDRTVVASVQTLCRPKRLSRFDPKRFGLLVIDEAHHAVARSYKEVIAHFSQNPDLRILGVTATPHRSDQFALGQVFDCVCYQYGIEDAITDGWLVPVRQQAIKVNGLDFSKVKTTLGDLNETELDAILTQEKVVHACAAPVAEIVRDQPTLVFCVSVNHARMMATVLGRYRGKQNAHALDGNSSADERQTYVKRFKDGEIQFLCNCGLFLEGFDAPNTACVVMARPTKSLSLYTQVLGRGTRPLPGIVDRHESAESRRRAIAHSKKPSMLALDFVGNAGKHRIIRATDLLGGRYGEPVKAYAKKTVEEEGEAQQAMFTDEQLERAKDELALLEEIAEEKKREKILAQVDYKAYTVSPFAGGEAHAPFKQEVAPKEPPTEKQVWYLVKRVGWAEDAARRLGKSQASAIIGKHRANS